MRSSFCPPWTRYLPLVAGLLFSSTSLADEVVPEDVLFMEKTHKLAAALSRTDNGDIQPLVNALTGRVIGLSQQIAQANGISVGRYFDDSFSRKIQSRIEARVRRAANDAPKDRLSNLQAIIREESARNTAHNALADQLGFQAPGSYVKSQPAKLLKKTAAAGAAATSGHPWLSKQMDIVGTTRRLSLVMDQSRLLQDSGGSGSGNGVIDAGEWIELEFGLENTGPRRYFSTSSWISVGHSCAWTPSDGENVAPELKPGGQFRLNGWVYISEMCAQGEEISVTIQSRDTHRFKDDPEAVTVELTVTNVGQASLNGTLIDRDVPGHSDGAGDAQRHGGGAQFELVTGLQTTGAAAAATMGYGSNRLTNTVVQQQSYEELPMERVESRSGRFDATDDLDIQLIDKKSYKTKVEEVAESEGWTRSEHAELLYATDSQVEIPSPFALHPDPTPPPALTPEEDCDTPGDEDGDGAADCDDSDCAEDADCAPEPAPLAGSRVVDLFLDHARIEATPTAPVSTDAVSAITHGYELVFDKSTFLLEYRCLVEGTTLAECGQPVCPDCPETVDAAAETEAEAEGGESLVLASSTRPQVSLYAFRNYLQVPIDWTPAPVAPPPPPPEPKAKPKPKVVKTPPPPKERKPLALRLDAGLNIGLVRFADVDPDDGVQEQGDAAGLEWDSSGKLVSRLGARALYGAGSLKPMAMVTMVKTESGPVFSENIMAGGLAYTMDFTDAIAVEPYLLAGFSSRGITIPGSTVSKTDLMVAPGASALYRVGGLGVYLGMEYQIVPPIEWVDEAAVSTTGLFGTLGISKYFY